VVDKAALGQDFLQVTWFLPCQYHFTVALNTHISCGGLKTDLLKPQFRDIVPPHQHGMNIICEDKNRNGKKVKVNLSISHEVVEWDCI
jgi:hypothetical protein